MRAVLIDLSGENELLIRVSQNPSANGNGRPRITFDQVTLNRSIPQGAQVLGKDVSTRLADTLGLGPRTSATLQDVEGVEEGSLLRILRGASIRLKFGPYSEAPAGLIRLLGRVVSRLSSVPLEGTRIELVEFNGSSVERNQDSGLDIFTVPNGGSTLILGTDNDVSTLTNSSGDYNLYLDPQRQFVLQSAVLRATRQGFESQARTFEAEAGKLRHKVDFELA